MAPSTALVATGDKSVVAIDPDQTLKASKALLSHIKKSSKQKATESSKRNLLDDSDGETSAAESPIWLTLTTKRHIVDKTRLQPGKIALPHPLHAEDDESLSICLITADPQRAYKDIVDSDAFPEETKRKVGRVIGFEKLKAKFGQYEAQRKLFSEHDVFMADDRIITRLPKVLGKTFFKSQAKRPVPVILTPKQKKVEGKKKNKGKTEGEVYAATPAQIAGEIEKALGSALVNLTPSTNTAVKIGYSGWTPEQIANNVNAVADALVSKWVPQKWNNVRSIHIKGPESAALPIWMTDELWVDDQDVISNAAAAAKKEKANVGKKRKSIAEADEEEEEVEEPKAKKKRASKKQEDLPDADDGVLDQQIAERKATLKKQKAKARKSMEA